MGSAADSVASVPVHLRDINRGNELFNWVYHQSMSGMSVQWCSRLDEYQYNCWWSGLCSLSVWLWFCVLGGQNTSARGVCGILINWESRVLSRRGNSICPPDMIPNDPGTGFIESLGTSQQSFKLPPPTYIIIIICSLKICTLAICPQRYALEMRSNLRVSLSTGDCVN